MAEFFNSLILTWWQIAIIVALVLAIVFILSIPLYRVFFKRFYDFILSLLALLVLSPIFIILTIVGAIAMKGNPFFFQKRPGRISKRTGKEKIFSLVKFRTMTNEKDENGKLLPDEKRLKGYGKFLRATSLDELPELLNILVGNMSIVGPRPQLVRDMVFMSGEQRERHAVRPGLTGLAQISGRNVITWEQKFYFDLIYIEKVTLFKDINIILRTIKRVLKGDDVVREGTVSDMDFGDWLLSNGKIDKDEYDEKQQKALELLSR